MHIKHQRLQRHSKLQHTVEELSSAGKWGNSAIIFHVIWFSSRTFHKHTYTWNTCSVYLQHVNHQHSDNMKVNLPSTVPWQQDSHTSCRKLGHYFAERRAKFEYLTSFSCRLHMKENEKKTQSNFGYTQAHPHNQYLQSISFSLTRVF